MFQYQYVDIPDVYSDEPGSKLVNLIKDKWKTIHSRQDVFKYNITNLHIKYVDKYLLQLNPERGLLRRPPDSISDICQPFNHSSFNFTKVKPDEVMFQISRNGESDIHTVLVNVSPINKYHSLLCPSVDKCLPQVVTRDSLKLVLEVAFLARNRDLRVGYNSLCAFASVNHLHYHLFLLGDKLAVETVKCQHLKGNVYIYSEENPVRGFVFQLKTKDLIDKISQEIFDLISLMIKRNIAHNLFVTRGEDLEGEAGDVLRIFVWPRKSSKGVEKVNTFYVALCELGGWFPVYTSTVYENLQSQEIEAELLKWKYDNFRELCQVIVESNIMENKMDSKKIYLLRHRSAVEDKRTGTIYLTRKKEAWEKICSSYNAVATSGARTVEQLKVFYDNKKQKARKSLAKHNGEWKKTHSGSCSPTESDCNQKVLALIKDQVTPLPNTCDIATVYFEDSVVGYTDIHNPLDIDSQTTCEQDLMSDSKETNNVNKSQIFENLEYIPKKRIPPKRKENCKVIQTPRKKTTNSGINYKQLYYKRKIQNALLEKRRIYQEISLRQQEHAMFIEEHKLKLETIKKEHEYRISNKDL